MNNCGNQYGALNEQSLKVDGVYVELSGCCYLRNILKISRGNVEVVSDMEVLVA